MGKFFISFKEFASDPVKAMLFIALIAIGYLYLDNKSVYQDQIDNQKGEIIELKNEVKELRGLWMEFNKKATESNE